MSLLGCIRAIFEGLAFKGESDRPIGLKHFAMEICHDELLNQLANPISPLPQFKPTISRKALEKAAPAFTQVPAGSYNYENYVDFFRPKGYPVFSKSH